MTSLDSALPLNTTLVHPPFFFIEGLHNVPDAKYYYVFLCFLFVVAVLGNFFVIFIIYTESILQVPKNMPIFNMAVADLGSTTALIPNVAATFLFHSQYISFDACLANMFFVFYFNSSQSHILVVMAYDRLVAICLPMRYHAIITMPAMAVISAVVWAFSALFVISIVALVTRLSLCKSIVVESFFCDHGSILHLTCNDARPNFIVAVIATIVYIYFPFLLIIISYMFIVGALFKIASWEGRFKAFKTCSTQLMLVAIYYLPQLIFSMNLLNETDSIINSSLSFAIRPMLDPIIYMLSTGEVRELLKKKIQVKRKTLLFTAYKLCTMRQFMKDHLGLV